MKLSSVAVLPVLSGLSITDYTLEVTCNQAPPATVTKTVTITAAIAGNCCPSAYLPLVTPPPCYSAQPTPYVTTVSGTISSVDYRENGYSTVWVYPTGIGSHDATVTIYQNNVIIGVNIVNINIQIVDGQITTATITKTDTVASITSLPPITSSMISSYSRGSNVWSNGTMTAKTRTTSGTGHGRFSSSSTIVYNNSTAITGSEPTSATPTSICYTASSFTAASPSFSSSVVSPSQLISQGSVTSTKSRASATSNLSLVLASASTTTTLSPTAPATTVFGTQFRARLQTEFRA